MSIGLFLYTFRTVRERVHPDPQVKSRIKEDIKDYNQKVSIPIHELSRENAAKLLLRAGENTLHLKSYKKPEDLAKHALFDVISYKPSGIVQLASLLQYKTLDEIVQEK